jgi:hypothetical protein
MPSRRWFVDEKGAGLERPADWRPAAQSHLKDDAATIWEAPQGPSAVRQANRTVCDLSSARFGQHGSRGREDMLL